jgi:formate hydrogenlyase regulatory protein HycA
VPRDDRLPFVGRFGGDGQFLTSVVLAGPPLDRAWFAVLHTFDGDGRHRASHVFRAGDEEEPQAERRAHEQQGHWLRKLSTMLLGAIEVEPFSRESHGLRFGVLEGEAGGYRLEPEGFELSSPGRP